jgi:hypothetical protein
LQLCRRHGTPVALPELSHKAPKIPEMQMIRSRRLLAILASLLLVATGLTNCATQDAVTAPTTEAAAQAAQLRVPILSGLLTCERQPYAITQQMVGPAGGIIHFGRHSLQIPRGALSSNVLITAEAPSDLAATARFQPEGLRFSRPATLTLDYSSCPLGRLRILKRIAYTTDKLDILSFLLSRDNLLLMRVSAHLEHFSKYAVAW